MADGQQRSRFPVLNPAYSQPESVVELVTHNTLLSKSSDTVHVSGFWEVSGPCRTSMSRAPSFRRRSTCLKGAAKPVGRDAEGVIQLEDEQSAPTTVIKLGGSVNAGPSASRQGAPAKRSRAASTAGKKSAKRSAALRGR
jgi:hypothetical protein